MQGAWLLAGGCLPFAAGAVLGEDGASVSCPFREATGLPCPFCGASRAFALAVRGDARFLDYNAVWVAVAALAIAVGLVNVARQRSLRVSAPAVIAVAMVLGWVCALAQRATIVG
jgi:hypothetical protein